ncbi:MAG: TetR/AcrR family transcriptional regulator [Treponema sp.]|nr:TetR/AcrR family transcriptional regulator [Treponema sp.]
MAIVVEHEKRKAEILTKALDVFIEEGYADVTFQKIADRCGITRTTLYIYFKNKRELFLWSIKHITAELEDAIMELVTKKEFSAAECLFETLMYIIQSIEDNKKLFNVILLYLLQLRKTGVDTRKRVARRFLRLRHVLSTIIIRGQKSGEFKQLSVRDVNDLFYGLIEAAVFRVVILAHDTMDDIRQTIALAVAEILAP